MVESKRPVDVFVDVLIHVVIVIACFLCLIPLLNTLALSLSSSVMASSGTVSFWPKQFTLAAYEAIVGEKQFFGAFWISIKRVVLGGAINFLMMVLCAFPLAHSEKAFRGRNVYMYFLIFTMLFSGGLVPTYIIVGKMGLMNTLWALILPGAISTYNMLIMRSAIGALPDALMEAAKLDGASHFQRILSVVVPLTGATSAVLMLYYAVGHWNAWFNASLYIQSPSRFPLQLVLRQVLILGEDSEMASGLDAGSEIAAATVIKYALIVISTVPIMLLYPFLQRFFVKGVMIGSVKG